MNDFMMPSAEPINQPSIERNFDYPWSIPTDHEASPQGERHRYDELTATGLLGISGYTEAFRQRLILRREAAPPA